FERSGMPSLAVPLGHGLRRVSWERPSPSDREKPLSGRPPRPNGGYPTETAPSGGLPDTSASGRGASSAVEGPIWVPASQYPPDGEASSPLGEASPVGKSMTGRASRSTSLVLLNKYFACFLIPTRLIISHCPCGRVPRGTCGPPDGRRDRCRWPCPPR